MEVSISRTRIDSMTAKLARMLSKDYAGKRPILVFILNSSYPFAAAVMEQMRIPCEVEFIRAQSYVRTEKQRAVSIQPGSLAGERLRGRHVIVLDTIIDTGETMAQVSEFIFGQSVASLSLACLINKQPTYRRTKIQPAVKYSCWTFLHGDYLVGYGLDYCGFLRGMPDIAKLKHVPPEKKEAIDKWLEKRTALLEAGRRGKRPRPQFGRNVSR